MAVGAGNEGTAAWVFLVVGAVIGVAVGVVVSVATDVPLAPEAGLAVGVLAGWLVLRSRRAG